MYKYIALKINADKNRKCYVGSKGKKCVGSSALKNKPTQSGRTYIIPVLIKDGD